MWSPTVHMTVKASADLVGGGGAVFRHGKSRWNLPCPDPSFPHLDLSSPSAG